MILKSEEIADKVVEALQDSKAHQIVKIENCFCNFFVICHGTSGTHIAGMTDAVEEHVRKEINERPFHTEGQHSSQWVVLDYGDVVVHIFDKELRDYYQLEEFWADADMTVIPDEE